MLRMVRVKRVVRTHFGVTYRVMESRVLRACEVLVLAARLVAQRPEEAALGAALALGRLARSLGRERFEALLGLARESWKAAR